MPQKDSVSTIVLPKEASKQVRSLMGLTGAGKSTFINRVAGSALAVRTSLASCTKQVASVQLELKDGTVVELVDTPGFNDSLRSDIEILDEIAQTLKSWDKENSNIHGIIYIHRISDVRMSGSSRKSFSVFYNICGEDAMPHVSIVTNMWDAISPKQGQAREAELVEDPLFFKKAINSNARIFRNDNPPDSTLEIVQKSIRPNPVQLLIQKELSDDKKDLLQTTAGIELDQEMAAKRVQHEAELLKIDREYTRAQQEQDDETLAELEEERECIRKKMQEAQAVLERLLERRAASVPRQEEYAVDLRPSDQSGTIQSILKGVFNRKTKQIDRKAGGYELSRWALGPNAPPEQSGPDNQGATTVAPPKAKRGFGREKSRSWDVM
ncbi:hypothetical protein FRC10_009200 [Ceratobasidium sp. 414]|nr:hypothetical protein FRC10_009200 [Ceratobasidium sp. 414]